MTPRSLWLGATAALLVGACGTAQEQPGGGMTAEEHARMSSGGGGVRDTAGAGRQTVHLTADQARAVGVTYTTVERGPLSRTVRTVGQVVPAEPNLRDITPKVDGFVEELYVNATGQAVRRGQPLLTLYSPMLVAAQQELLSAGRLAASVDSGNREPWRAAQELLGAARRRLAYWDISSEQIARLEQTGEITKALTLAAPFDGVVLEKMVVAGQAVMAGMKLYRLADLSTVWIEGDVFELDLAAVRVGAAARVELTAFPGRSFSGRVSFVWPVVNPESRTARIRVGLSNTAGAFKPGMYGTLLFEARLRSDALTVPAQAVVMTGARDLVFLVGPEGSFEPREVIVGQRAGDRLEILDGVRAGDRIVASANFLVDAESRLASGGAMAGMPGMPDMPGMPAAEKKKP